MFKRAVHGVLLLAAVCTAPAARAWSCEHGTAASGDTRAAVKRKCGQPDFVYSPVGYYRRGHYLPVDEDWYYNAGPLQLLRVLHFHRGRLQAIDTPGYGFDAGERRRCTPAELRAGLSVYQLLARCGKPRRRRDRSARLRGRGAAEVLIRREQWIYDFGAGYLPQALAISNGVVESVQATSRARSRRQRAH